MSDSINIPRGWVPFVEPDGSVVYRPPNYGMPPSPHTRPNYGSQLYPGYIPPRYPGYMPQSPQQQYRITQPRQNGMSFHAEFEERLKGIELRLMGRIVDLEKRIDRLEENAFTAIENGDDTESNKPVQNLYDEYAKDTIVAVRKTVAYIGRPNDVFDNDLNSILKWNWAINKSKLQINDDFADYLLTRSGAYIHSDPDYMRTIVQLDRDYDHDLRIWTGEQFCDALALLTVYNADDYIVYLKLAVIKDDDVHYIMSVE